MTEPRDLAGSESVAGRDDRRRTVQGRAPSHDDAQRVPGGPDSGWADSGRLAARFVREDWQQRPRAFRLVRT